MLYGFLSQPLKEPGSPGFQESYWMVEKDIGNLPFPVHLWEKHRMNDWS